jgi:hypothetical protein
MLPIRVQCRRQNGSYECHSDHRNHTLEPNIFDVLSICYLLQVAHTLVSLCTLFVLQLQPESRVYSQRNAPAISLMCLPSSYHEKPKLEKSAENKMRYRFYHEKQKQQKKPFYMQIHSIAMLQRRPPPKRFGNGEIRRLNETVGYQ